MGLKQAVIDTMAVRQLRKAVRELDVRVENDRQKRSLAAGLSGSRRATAEALLGFLSERDIKRLCTRRGVDSKGRRHELVARLLGSPAGRSQAKGRSELPRYARGGPRESRLVADLQFGHSTDRAGFTPAGIAAFSDLRPAAVVRELIQNSLDAALIDAQEPCARVRFARSTCTLAEIPGIGSYRAAFQKALQEHPPTGSARPVVERIKRTLEQDSHEVLSVTDNGVGLDGRRMSALLSDGVSAKGGDATGTFGNGHSVVVPASDLRYVLYGGLTIDGRSYGAGQAVLASHRDEGDWQGRSGRGVYLRSFKPESSEVPFTLAQGGDIPQVVALAIERVRADHGHGAAVVIPAFNNFGHRQSLKETVFRASAFNFFQAIHEGRLVVEVDDPEEADVLEATNLREVLSAYRDEQRLGRAGAFLSGRKANEAYETLVDGESYDVKTALGDVAVQLVLRETGRRSVGLCRNGMWITEELPMFQGAFADRQPFQALILLDSDRKSGFFEHVQEAETPLHDKLALKQMEPERQRSLRNSLRELRDGIKQLVPATTEEVYPLQDILAFQFDDVEGQGKGGRQPSYWGRVGSTRRASTVRRKVGKREPGGPGQGGGGGGRKRRDGRTVVEPIFRIASVPIGAGRRAVHVECSEEFDDAELRMFVDENVDATCDRQTRAQAASVLLSNVAVNGRALQDGELVDNGDGACVGAKLGALSPDAKVVVETDFAIPEAELRVRPGQEPALRIEILSSRQVSPKDGRSADASEAV